MASDSPEKRVHIRLRQTLELFKTLFRNRMAAVGFVLIVISTFFALAAPLLTPYAPAQQLVAGPFAQPAFTMAFPEGYHLSQNLAAVADPNFNSPSSIQAWTVTAAPSTRSNLALSYAPGVVPVPASKGSLLLSYSGSGPGRIVLTRTFHYPYHGPPSSFFATLSYLITGNSVANPVELGLSINRVGDQLFTLWDQNITVGGVWQVPSIAANGVLSSDSPALQSALNVKNTLLSGAAIVFSTPQDYSYQVSIAFYGPGKVNLDQVQLQLLGTAFGLLGTDYVGSDVATQLFWGTRISLLVGLTAAALGIALGLIVGLVAGFMGTLTDEILMRFTDMILVIPYLPLLIVLVAVLGASITNIILVIGLFSWMGFARVIRSQVLSLKERPFIEAARASGASSTRVMFTHIFPNIVSLTYVNLALTVPAAILTEAALEFLGLGDVNTISWGHMFYLAQISSALTVWWWVIPPGLAIAAVSLSFVLIGYALDELFNPKLRRRR